MSLRPTDLHVILTRTTEAARGPASPQQETLVHPHAQGLHLQKEGERRAGRLARSHQSAEAVFRKQKETRREGRSRSRPGSRPHAGDGRGTHVDVEA